MAAKPFILTVDSVRLFCYPIDEIAGFVRHPILGKTMHQLYTQLESK